MWKFFSRKKRRSPGDETLAELQEKFRLETVSSETAIGNLANFQLPCSTVQCNQ